MNNAPIFDGISVVEIASEVAGPVAGLLLADHGADVVKVEPPGGHPERSAPAFAVYNRSKHSFVADLETDEGRVAVTALLRQADVAIVDLVPGEAERLGVDYVSASSANPSLVYLAMPPFGDGGPMCDVAADEAVVRAFAGGACEQGSYDGTPTHIILPVAGVAGGILGASGVATALLQRERIGTGQKVTMSMLASMLAVQSNAFIYGPRQVREEWYLTHPRGPTPAFSMFHGSDGRWFACAVLNDRFWANLAHALGRPEWVEEFDYGGAYRKDPSQDRRDVVFDELEAAFLQRPADEWMATLAAADIPVGPVLTTTECLDEPQTRHNGMRVEIEDASLGPTVQAGIPIRFQGSLLPAPRPAPRIGEGDAMPALRFRPPKGFAPPHPSAPLAGIRVIDLGSYIAGTVGGQILADLGADVLKVESLAGDSFRTTGIEFLTFNRGKRSISLDLHAEEAREAVRRLAREADVFIQNVRPGAMAKLGLDYETLSAVNPRLVYASVSAFGSTGPRSAEPGFDLLAQAFTGGPLIQGGDGEPVNHTAAYADYGAAMMSAFGVQAALFERERTGRGQHFETSLLDAAAFFTAGASIQAKGVVPPKGGPAFKGLSPYYRLYATADGWIFVDARAPGARVGLRSVTGVATATVGDGADASPAAELAAAFARRPCDEWLEVLGKAGVLAVPVRRPFQVLDDPQVRINRLADTRPHPEFGDVTQAGALIQFSRTPAKVQRPAPLLGEHTREILAEARYSAAEIDALIANGIAKTSESTTVVITS